MRRRGKGFCAQERAAGSSAVSFSASALGAGLSEEALLRELLSELLWEELAAALPLCEVLPLPASDEEPL